MKEINKETEAARQGVVPPVLIGSYDGRPEGAVTPPAAAAEAA